jgi:hypothetical protein
MSSAKDIWLTNIWQQYISCLTNSQKKCCIRILYIDFRCIFQADILFAKEIGKFFALTEFHLLNSIAQCRHNIKLFKISSVDIGTLLFQSPKSCDTVPSKDESL